MELEMDDSNLKIVILSEICQRKKNVEYGMAYAESKKWHKWTYFWNRLTDVENEHMVAKGKDGGKW